MLAAVLSGANPTPPAVKPQWRIIPALDRNPKIVAAVQTLPGRVGLVAAMAALSALSGPLGVDIRVAPFAAAIAYTGVYRRYLIPLATLLLLYLNGFWINLDQMRAVITQEGLANTLDATWLVHGALLAVLAASCSLMAAWPRFASAPFFRRPAFFLIAVFLGLAVTAQIATGMPRAVLWSLVIAFQPFLWFLAYALSDAGALKRNPLWQHLGVFHPFWGSTATPFGKGLTYLEKYDAKTPEDLAVTQLKGLKLACWLLVLAVCLAAFDHVIYVLLRLPRFDQVFVDYLAGTHDPRALGWLSLVTDFVDDVLTITLWGGAIVVCARLAGFRLLRNTWRPLEARTLAEFWNRYYFYFKELLVDHFFYPIFLRYFRGHRRLRIFFATFMAACVGNLLYHFIRDIHFVAELGWRQAVTGEASHAFYTFLLALGVGLSQARGRPHNPGTGWLRGRVAPALWVITFFCLLHVFDAPTDRIHSIGQRAHFLSYLLGADTWM